MRKGLLFDCIEREGDSKDTQRILIMPRSMLIYFRISFAFTVTSPGSGMGLSMRYSPGELRYSTHIYQSYPTRR